MVWMERSAEGNYRARHLIVRKCWLEMRSDSSAEFPVEGSLYTTIQQMSHAPKNFTADLLH